jgi:hypothetical protein
MAKAKQPEWLKYNDDGSADITLSRPAELNNMKQSVVRMREPTVRDQEAVSEMSGTDASREIHAFANLCDLSPEDLRQMPLRDFMRLQTAYRGFID